MYYISKVYNNGYYGVVDTRDNIEEVYSEVDIRNFISKGLTIEGVSDKSISSYIEKFKLKCELAGVSYLEPLDFNTYYRLYINLGDIILAKKVGLYNDAYTVLEKGLHPDRASHLIDKGLKFDNILNSFECNSLDKICYLLCDGRLHNVNDLVSLFRKEISDILFSVYKLDLCFTSDFKRLKDNYIDVIKYNRGYNVFILEGQGLCVIVKFGISGAVRSSFRLFGNALGKHIELRDFLYAKLYRNSIRSVEILDHLPMKYVNSICGNWTTFSLA